MRSQSNGFPRLLNHHFVTWLNVLTNSLLFFLFCSTLNNYEYLIISLWFFFHPNSFVTIDSILCCIYFLLPVFRYQMCLNNIKKTILFTLPIVSGLTRFQLEIVSTLKWMSIKHKSLLNRRLFGWTAPFRVNMYKNSIGFLYRLQCWFVA